SAIRISSMHATKKDSFTDDQSEIGKQDNVILNPNSTTCQDVDSPVRSYAIIESNSNELDQVIDVLRKFFPRTRIVEYNQSKNNLSNVTKPQKQTSIESTCNSPFSTLSKSSFDSDTNNDQVSLNLNARTFKGKLKDYLQRRYLQQLREHDSRKEAFTKSHSANVNSFDFSSSSTISKPIITSKSHSFDLSSVSMQANSSSIARSQSKRGLLQHYSTIDTDDTSNDTEQIKSNQHDEDDNESASFPQSYSEQQQTNNNCDQWRLPFQHFSEYESDIGISSFPNKISLPLTSYSASSDPGPYHSSWYNTPTSSSRFLFPQSQEQLAANAQGSIAQLSTLTQMLCDESSLFTPVSSRFKTEKHDSLNSKDSSSVLLCHICRQEFDSRQMYLAHYRTHLENSCQNDVSDILDFDCNYDQSSNSRNYSCKICSKHFSRSDMLNRHFRLHSGTRPYRCAICNTYFSRSDHLSTHLRTHTGEKPYTCPQCSYTACRRDMITRHIKTHTKQRSERKHATSTFASSNES
ncbi:unnamed protein product, partial [Rotaria socialis]